MEAQRNRRRCGAGAGKPIAAEDSPWPRERLLPRLIGVGPDEIADDSRAGRLGILKRLMRALRGERMRGRAGHWTYSLDRHVGLVRAVAAEKQALAMLAMGLQPERTGGGGRGDAPRASGGRDRGVAPTSSGAGNRGASPPGGVVS